jgi:hypothetical protein
MDSLVLPPMEVLTLRVRSPQSEARKNQAPSFLCHVMLCRGRTVGFLVGVATLDDTGLFWTITRMILRPRGPRATGTRSRRVSPSVHTLAGVTGCRSSRLQPDGLSPRTARKCLRFWPTRCKKPRPPRPPGFTTALCSPKACLTPLEGSLPSATTFAVPRTTFRSLNAGRR